MNFVSSSNIRVPASAHIKSKESRHFLLYASTPKNVSERMNKLGVLAIFVMNTIIFVSTGFQSKTIFVLTNESNLVKNPLFMTSSVILAKKQNKKMLRISR